MRITSAIRALLTYYWNIWYFLAAILGSMASLFLGAWISSEANGTPITGGYSFFFTGTQPLISLALLFILDARVSKVHYGVCLGRYTLLGCLASCALSVERF